MIRFDVEVNDEPYCRAGLDPTGVISVILSWVELTPAVLASPVANRVRTRPCRSTDIG